MKRYFSNLVDMYPEDSANFKAREHAKRCRRDYDDALKALEDTNARLFNVDFDEPLIDGAVID